MTNIILRCIIKQTVLVFFKYFLLESGIKVSVAETAGAALKDSRLAVALGPLLVTPLVVIVLLSLAFLYFGYSLER